MYIKYDFTWTKGTKMSLYYMHIFIKQRCIKLIKNDSKDIYNVIKDFYGFCKNMKQHNFYFILK